MLWDYNYLRQIALNFLNWRIKKKSNRLLEEIVTLTNTLSFQLQQISTERRKKYRCQIRYHWRVHTG